MYFNKHKNQVTINRDNRKSLENAIDMQLQLLQVVEHTNYTTRALENCIVF